nr:MAG TPA: hypothetical protein [Caudoviricetes sp.]
MYIVFDIFETYTDTTQGNLYLFAYSYLVCLASHLSEEVAADDRVVFTLALQTRKSEICVLHEGIFEDYAPCYFAVFASCDGYFYVVFFVERYFFHRIVWYLK